MIHLAFQTLYARLWAHLRHVCSLWRTEHDLAPTASACSLEATQFIPPGWIVIGGWGQAVPISSGVALLRRMDGLWSLTDWRREGTTHATFEAAMADRAAFRRLTFGEPLE